jgi:hypothetical protein
MHKHVDPKINFNYLWYNLNLNAREIKENLRNFIYAKINSLKIRKFTLGCYTVGQPFSTPNADPRRNLAGNGSTLLPRGAKGLFVMISKVLRV